MRTISTAARQLQRAMEQRAKRSGSISSWSAFTWPPNQASRPRVTQRHWRRTTNPSSGRAFFWRQRKYKRYFRPIGLRHSSPENRHQDATHQPEQRHPRPPLLSTFLCRQHHRGQSPLPRCQNADHEFGDTARADVLRREFRPCPADAGPAG